MTSLSGVVAGTAPAAITTSTSLAAIASPKPVAQPANPASIGPAATLNLSQAALAKLKGDQDWKPGLAVDSF
ncbi:MAG TPA: hypothetical protein VKV73_00330 [Chloroflexota bacterium]|nr:hypothetical protein [Chloroflexota bacterium]